MTFQVVLIMIGIFQLLTVFWEYKRPQTITGFKFSWSIVTQMFLSVLALSEFFTFGTFYTSYLLAFALWLAMMYFLSHFMKYIRFLWNSKFQTHFNKNKVDALFYLNFKIRQLCSVDKISQTFFYNNKGATIFFGDPDKKFNAMSETTLKIFKDNLTQSTMGHVRFGGFIVIKNKDDYISLSSDEFKMLGVPVTEITHDHLNLIQMVRI
jgi:hypothetical protein